MLRARYMLLIALFSPVFGFGQTAGDLLNTAAEKEAKASMELAGLREQIEAEHAALQEKVRQAYEALEQAKGEALNVSIAKNAAEQELKKLKQRSASEAIRTQLLLRELLIAAQVPVLPGQSWDEVELAIRAGIEEQLQVTAGQAAIQTSSMELLNHHGLAVDVPVVKIAGAQMVALGNDLQSCGLVQKTPDGHAFLVGVPPRKVPMAGNLLIDVSGRMATLKPQKRFVQHYLSSGGMFLYPILAVGLLGLILVGERVVNMFRHRSAPTLLDAVIDFTKEGLWDKAGALVVACATPLQRVLHRGIETRTESREKRESFIENAILEEVPRLERSMTMIAACAAIAPLLGLLGTVTGMIQTFKALGLDAGGDALSQGISEALITTQVGLVVAVPLLLLHAAFNRLIDRRVIRLEQAGHAMLAIVSEQGPDHE